MKRRTGEKVKQSGRGGTERELEEAKGGQRKPGGWRNRLGLDHEDSQGSCEWVSSGRRRPSIRLQQIVKDCMHNDGPGNP